MHATPRAAPGAAVGTPGDRRTAEADGGDQGPGDQAPGHPVPGDPGPAPPAAVAASSGSAQGPPHESVPGSVPGSPEASLRGSPPGSSAGSLDPSSSGSAQGPPHESVPGSAPGSPEAPLRGSPPDLLAGSLPGVPHGSPAGSPLGSLHEPGAGSPPGSLAGSPSAASSGLLSGVLDAAPPVLRQAVRYALVGVASTVLNAVLFYVLRAWWDPVPASAVSLVLSTAYSTEAHRRYTFTAGSIRPWRLHLQSIGTVVFYAWYGVVVLAILHALVADATRLHETVAIAAASLMGGVSRFLLLRSWVFAPPAAPAAVPAPPAPEPVPAGCDAGQGSPRA